MKPFLQQLLLVTLYLILIVQGRRSAQAAGPLVSMEPVPAPTAPALQASGHPDLRVPADKRDWPAARPPLWQPVLAAFDEPQAIVEYDPAQRREFTRAMALADTAAAGTDTAAPPFEGLLPQPITPETVIAICDTGVVSGPEARVPPTGSGGPGSQAQPISLPSERRWGQVRSWPEPRTTN